MDPSFLALYKRGNYFKRELTSRDPEERQRKREERERFAMAAIGFCLKYDRDFPRYFGKAILGHVDEQAELDRIQIEQKLWGDLVLQTTNGIYVIEGKIKAPLQDKQNPTKGDAFWKHGYGGVIIHAFGTRKDLHYVLLGYPEKLNMPNRRELKCSQVSWEQLEREFPENAQIPRNSLASDLANCLAALDVDSFYLRETKSMKISNPGKTAEALRILDAARRKIGFRDSEAKFQHKFKVNEWFFGYSLYFAKRNSSSGVNLASLRKLVSPKRREPIAWFGYENIDQGRGRRSIWFFCGSKTAQQKLLRKLNRSGKLRPSHMIAPPLDEPGTEAYVCIVERSPRAALIPDQKWFADGFRAAGLYDEGI
jgi:hypothetical protein